MEQPTRKICFAELMDALTIKREDFGDRNAFDLARDCRITEEECVAATRTLLGGPS